MTDFEDMLLKMLLKIQRQAPCVWRADDSVDGLFYHVTQAMAEDALVDAVVTPREISVTGLTPDGEATLVDLQYEVLSTRPGRNPRPGHETLRPVPAIETAD